MDANPEALYRVSLGPVLQAKIHINDPYWATFNASFTNREVRASELAGQIYDGHPITTWHKNHWRANRNYLCGQHLGIDFDTEDARSTLPVLLRDPFIARYASLLYTTPSHTPATPRARVIFLLDTPIRQPQNYTLAAAALLWMFGAADRQCKDPARFFYGGKPGACEMEYLGYELPLALVKDLIQRYQRTGAQTRRHITHQYTPRNADEHEVMEALRHIPAWGIDYGDWVRVLMAIHAEWPGPNGLAMAEAWAEGKPGEVAQKWRSFHLEGNASGKVTLGTLFELAQRYGWQQASALAQAG